MPTSSLPSLWCTPQLRFVLSKKKAKFPERRNEFVLQRLVWYVRFCGKADVEWIFVPAMALEILVSHWNEFGGDGLLFIICWLPKHASCVEYSGKCISKILKNWVNFWQKLLKAYLTQYQYQYQYQYQKFFNISININISWAQYLLVYVTLWAITTGKSSSAVSEGSKLEK